MQINLKWRRDRYSDPFELLDPKRNLEIACSTLIEALASSPDDVVLGIGRYHSWKNEAVSRKYGMKVIRVWNRLRNLRS